MHKLRKLSHLHQGGSANKTQTTKPSTDVNDETVYADIAVFQPKGQGSKTDDLNSSGMVDSSTPS